MMFEVVASSSRSEAALQLWIFRRTELRQIEVQEHRWNVGLAYGAGPAPGSTSC